jgi:hypothetical protein
MLLLADYEGMSKDEVKEQICGDYDITLAELNRFKILIAYQHEGSWGCDSGSWFVLRERKTDKLFLNRGGHCSCYGFEGQFEPGLVTKKYLLSRSFGFPRGGYDNDDKSDFLKVYVESVIFPSS